MDSLTVSPIQSGSTVEAQGSKNSLEQRITILEQQLAATQSTPVGAKEIQAGGHPQIRVEELVRIIGGLVGLAAGVSFLFYLLGFVIVNEYLLSFGVRDFALTQPDYVAAGVLFVFVHTPTGLLLFMLLDIDMSGQFGRVKAILIWPMRLMTIAAIGLEIYLVLSLFANVPITLSAQPQYMPYVIRLTLFILGIYPWSLLYHWSYRRFPSLRAYIVRAASLALFGLLLLFLLLRSWATYVYGYLPSAYGGGAPVSIQVVITDASQAPLFTGIGVPIKQNVSDILQLLHYGDKAIIVRLNNGDAASLDKSLISNILYLHATPTPAGNSAPTATPMP